MLHIDQLVCLQRVGINVLTERLTTATTRRLRIAHGCQLNKEEFIETNSYYRSVLYVSLVMRVSTINIKRFSKSATIQKFSHTQHSLSPIMQKVSKKCDFRLKHAKNTQQQPL